MCEMRSPDLRTGHRPPLPEIPNRPPSLQQQRAMIAPPPATVQCIPAHLQRAPIAVLQPAATTPDPTTPMVRGLDLFREHFTVLSRLWNRAIQPLIPGVHLDLFVGDRDAPPRFFFSIHLPTKAVGLILG